MEMETPYKKSAVFAAIEMLNQNEGLLKSTLPLAQNLGTVVRQISLFSNAYSQAAVLSKFELPYTSTFNFFNDVTINKLALMNPKLDTALSFFETIDKFKWLNDATVYKNLGLCSLKTNDIAKSIFDCVNGVSFFHVNNRIELLSRKCLDSLNYETIFSRFDTVSPHKNLFVSNLVNLTAAYSKISTQVISTERQRSIYNITAKDYFINAQLVELLSTTDSITEKESTLIEEINEEHNSNFEIMLSKLNPHFHRKWKGAVQVLESDFEDRISQFATSVREILGHTLRTIAPEDDVLKWLDGREDKSMYDNNSKPTRAAKIEFICRNCDNKNIIDYMKKKRTAIISVFDILNSGTHKIEPAFSQLEANFLKIGMESDLNYLLQIHFQFNS